MQRYIAAVIAILLSGLCAYAQEWPAKTVRIIVPFAAGATPDLVARLIAERLQEQLGQSFIVENKPGASGNAGTDAVAKAIPDGTTIGISIGGPLAINTLLFAHLPYDPRKDLTLITLLATQPSALAVNASLGVNSVPELVDVIRRNPGKYNFGSIGTGSLSQLAMEAIALKSGTRMVHVPYASSPQAVTALMRNEVQMVCLPAISITPQLGDGVINLVAITTAKRSPLLPGVPTLREAGVDVQADAWMGLIAPAGISGPVAERINHVVGEAITSPAIRQKLFAQVMEPIPGTPAEFRSHIDAEIARWRPVIAAAKIKVE
jgi:tripartite-type tricarboxylate transporter receptor subunit TctC